MAELNFSHLQEVESTQDVVKEFIQKNDLVCVLADKQISGRGRSGNRWESGDKDFICSIGIKLPVSVDKLTSSALVAGVTIHGALELSKFGIGLKWPNDLVQVGTKKKLGGILIESSSVATGNLSTSLIIGIGINYFSNGINKPECCVGLHDLFSDKQFSRNTTNQDFVEYEKLAKKITFMLLDAYTELIKNGFDRFRLIWQQFSAHKINDSTISVIIDPNTRVEGTYMGLSESGMLQLQTSEGLKSVHSGHVESW